MRKETDCNCLTNTSESGIADAVARATIFLIGVQIISTLRVQTRTNTFYCVALFAALLAALISVLNGSI